MTLAPVEDAMEMDDSDKMANCWPRPNGPKGKTRQKHASASCWLEAGIQGALRCCTVQPVPVTVPCCAVQQWFAVAFVVLLGAWAGWPLVRHARLPRRLSRSPPATCLPTPFSSRQETASSLPKDAITQQKFMLQPKSQA